ncbi:MAG: hypothetical protein R3300_20150 [Candidatus Promineifilaceae bacterium]|nr:hypothetical protein [Candidatus Promineifilaceae bacterium]
MSALDLTEERIAGGMLIAPVLFGLMALVIGIVSGAAAGYGPAVQEDLKTMAEYAGTIYASNLLFVIIWVVHLLGVALLARLLYRAGAEQLAILTYTLFLFAVVSVVAKFTFDMVLELWAAQQVAQGASVPALYEPLSTWTSSLARLGYIIHIAAMLLIGWALLRTRVVNAALAWTALGWSGLWLAVGLFGLGVPAVPLLMPAAIGVALLAK